MAEPVPADKMDGTEIQVPEESLKKIVLVSLAVLLAFAALPQTAAAGIGIKGGFSLARFSASTTEPMPISFVNNAGVVAGVSADLGFGPLSIQPEILYARMGAKAQVESVEIKYLLDYIQVPVLLKLRVVQAGPVRPVICAGGYGSWMIKGQGSSTNGVDSESEDITEYMNRFDYGFVGGAGVEFKLPGVRLSVEGRYNFGLANVLKDPENGSVLKNRTLMALIGVGF